jgi:hypothetical protein
MKNLVQCQKSVSVLRLVRFSAVVLEECDLVRLL